MSTLLTEAITTLHRSQSKEPEERSHFTEGEGAGAMVAKQGLSLRVDPDK